MDAPRYPSPKCAGGQQTFDVQIFDPNLKGLRHTVDSEVTRISLMQLLTELIAVCSIVLKGERMPSQLSLSVLLRFMHALTTG